MNGMHNFYHFCQDFYHQVIVIKVKADSLTYLLTGVSFSTQLMAVGPVHDVVTQSQVCHRGASIDLDHVCNCCASGIFVVRRTLVQKLCKRCTAMSRDSTVCCM